MEVLALELKLILSFVLGGFIGFEREINEKKLLDGDKKPSAILGVRTFSLVAAFGALTGIIYDVNQFFSILLGSTVMILMIAFYVIDSIQTKDSGMTTEIALMYAFLIGLFISLDLIPVQIIIALTIVVTLLLSKKEKIKSLTQDVKKHELNSFIAYAIIALVILPFLPNQNFSIGDIPQIKQLLSNFSLPVQNLINIDIFNPFKLWLIVTLITGVDMLGYFLEKTIGSSKGWILASFAGGFISSTATTQSIAQQSKEGGNVNTLVSAAILSNFSSFIQISIILIAINIIYFINILPVVIPLLISSLILSFLFITRKTKTEQTKIILKEPKIFEIVPALKFASIFLLITIFSKVSLELFGQNGLLITSGIGALAGLDAVMINISELAGKSIDIKLAALAFITANAVNLFAKSFYSFVQGNREFAVRFFISMLIIVISSLTGLFFL